MFYALKIVVYMEKYGTALPVTDDNMARAHCMLDN
jgi:hypothetical protein